MVDFFSLTALIHAQKSISMLNLFFCLLLLLLWVCILFVSLTCTRENKKKWERREYCEIALKCIRIRCITVDLFVSFLSFYSLYLLFIWDMINGFGNFEVKKKRTFCCVRLLSSLKLSRWERTIHQQQQQQNACCWPNDISRSESLFVCHSMVNSELVVGSFQFRLSKTLYILFIFHLIVNKLFTKIVYSLIEWHFTASFLILCVCELLENLIFSH